MSFLLNVTAIFEKDNHMATNMSRGQNCDQDLGFSIPLMNQSSKLCSASQS